MELSIRKAISKDIPQILSLLEQVLSIHAQGRPDLFIDHTTKYTKEELEEILQEESRPIFVAVKDEEVLGYAFCEIQVYENLNNMYDHKTLFIDDLCVDEAYRGEKIGKRLFQYVEEYAKEIDCNQITLNVWAFNEAAIHFYEQNGLCPMKYVMEKKI
ncbi:MAG: GNAT family N-acetyltransferase [Solobacterium sp.]|nr:GNAT family N-acetyltransferase [Solobacterium sp.]